VYVERLAADSELALEYRWRVVAVLFSVGAVNYADRTAISSVFPLLRTDLGASDVELAAIGSLFLWSYAIGSPYYGFLADRVSRSRMIFWSLLAWSLVTLCTAMVRDAHQLLATRVLLGFAESAYLPAAIALIADHHGVKTRGTALGIHLAGLSVGLVAGGAGAGYAGDHFGWRYAFVFLGCVGLVLAGLTRAVLRDVGLPPDPVRRSPVRDVLELARIPSYVILLSEAMLISVGTWIFFNWLPLYFKERYGMSLTMAGFSGTFIPQIATVAGVVLGGYFSDRIARGRSERRMITMSACYMLSAPLLFAFRMNPSASVLSVCILSYSFLRALGTSNEGPLICDLLEPRLRSTAIALCNTLNCAAGGVGVFVTGYLKHDFGLAGAFSFVSLIIVAAAVSTFAGYSFFIRNDLNRVSRADFAYGKSSR